MKRLMDEVAALRAELASTKLAHAAQFEDWARRCDNAAYAVELIDKALREPIDPKRTDVVILAHRAAFIRQQRDTARRHARRWKALAKRLWPTYSEATRKLKQALKDPRVWK